jgi:dienelactone hydrolase
VAGHAFNLPAASGYRRDDDLDAWQRTLHMLHQYQPLP